MFGEGRVAFVDAPDIAAVAAELLTNPRHQGASYTLTGPEALSAAEVAERLSAAAGHAATATNEVARITGRPPRTFAQFAADHRVAFGAQPS